MNACLAQQVQVATIAAKNAAKACKAEQVDPSFAAGHGGKSFADHRDEREQEERLRQVRLVEGQCRGRVAAGRDAECGQEVQSRTRRRELCGEPRRQVVRGHLRNEREQEERVRQMRLQAREGARLLVLSSRTAAVGGTGCAVGGRETKEVERPPSSVSAVVRRSAPPCPRSPPPPFPPPARACCWRRMSPSSGVFWLLGGRAAVVPGPLL